MTDFKSEMREVVEKSITQLMTWQDKKRNKDWIDKECDLALSSLLALIEKRMPKEKDIPSLQNLLDDYNQGFNSCLSEIKKEMGI